MYHLSKTLNYLLSPVNIEIWIFAIPICFILFLHIPLEDEQTFLSAEENIC